MQIVKVSVANSANSFARTFDIQKLALGGMAGVIHMYYEINHSKLLNLH